MYMKLTSPTQINRAFYAHGSKKGINYSLSKIETIRIVMNFITYTQRNRLVDIAPTRNCDYSTSKSI